LALNGTTVARLEGEPHPTLSCFHGHTRAIPRAGIRLELLLELDRCMPPGRTHGLNQIDAALGVSKTGGDECLAPERQRTRPPAGSFVRVVSDETHRPYLYPPFGPAGVQKGESFLLFERSVGGRRT
jgi:hypothetical protein